MTIIFHCCIALVNHTEAKMNRQIFLSLIFLLIIASCQPSETAIQTAVAQTQASYTATPSPTETLQPTPTITFTPTPDPLDYLGPYLNTLQQWGENLAVVSPK